MSRLLFAAMLSFLLHGLLFIIIPWDGLREKQTIRPITRTVAVALSYKKPNRPPAAQTIRPIRKPPVMPEPPPKKMKKTPLEKPVIKKDVSEPVAPEPLPQAKADESLLQDKDPPVQENPSVDSPGKDISTAYMLKEATPLYKDNPPPSYPRIARRRGHQGVVTLEVLVSREGKVKDLAVYQSSGYASLDDAAKASVWHWLFVPGMKGEQPMEMWVKLPVRFQLK